MIDIKSHQRYLIDYKKSSANLLAGFTSRRFSILGLKAAHPLYYSNAVPVVSQPQLTHVSSRITACYALNRCTAEDIEDILHLLLQTNVLKNMDKGKKRSSCNDLKSLLKENISEQLKHIMNKLIVMENITAENSPARIATLPGYENEKDCTKLRDLLVNNGLASSIKKANKNIIQKFMEKN